MSKAPDPKLIFIANCGICDILKAIILIQRRDNFLKIGSNVKK